MEVVSYSVMIHIIGTCVQDVAGSSAQMSSGGGDS